MARPTGRDSLRVSAARPLGGLASASYIHIHTQSPHHYIECDLCFSDSRAFTFPDIRPDIRPDIVSVPDIRWSSRHPPVFQTSASLPDVSQSSRRQPVFQTPPCLPDFFSSLRPDLRRAPASHLCTASLEQFAGHSLPLPVQSDPT